jgi:multidrug efflux pump subunit AcrB
VAASPRLNVSIDDRKATALGVKTAYINAALSSALVGTYIYDFINALRVKKIYMQGDADYRMQPEDTLRWRVRNSAGGMVPLSSFDTVDWASDPSKLERYNGLSSI